MKKDIINMIKEELQASTVDTSREAREIMQYIPDYLIDLSEDYDFLIAGGMVTSIFARREIADIDVYITNEKHLPFMVVDLLHNSTIVTATDRSMLVNHSGTLINIVYFKFFKDAQDIFNSFDFTAVMGAFDIRSQEFTLHRDFMKDLAKRELVFNPSTDFPIVSAMRVAKYTDRGFHISKKAFVSIVLRCMQLEIKTYKELESQIGGMYGINLSKMIDTEAEFSLPIAIDALLNSHYDMDSVEVLRFRKDDRETRKNILKNIVGKVKGEFFKLKGSANVFIVNNGRLIQIDNSLKELLESKVVDFKGDFKIYKFVRKTDVDGVYSSYWKKDYVYKIGESVKDSSSRGMWGGCLNKSRCFANSSKSDRALIELSVNADDIISVNSNDMQFRKAVVVREMKGKYESNNAYEINMSDLFD